MFLASSTRLEFPSGRSFLSLATMAVATLGIAAEPDASSTPFGSVLAAYNDVQHLPMGKTIRYLSIYNLPLADRPKMAETVSFVLNSLSKEKIISRPVLLPGGFVLRVDLSLYGIDPQAWDRLAANGSGPVDSQFPDPYFHALLVTEKIVEDGFNETEEIKKVPFGYTDKITGKEVIVEYREQKIKVRKPKFKTVRKKTFASAPWLALDGGKAISKLVVWCETESPILRADWFITYATWAGTNVEGKAVGYYDLLGLGKRIEDFEALAYADSKLAAKARSQTKGAMIFSGVSLHNRGLEREPTFSKSIGGYKWRSLDVLKSTDDKDYVNNLLDQRFDATEDIASLANGLQVYFLTDGKGNRLDFANPNVAIDGETPLRDKLIYSARNCMTCHSAGMRVFEDEVRSLARDKVALLAASGSKEAKENARRVLDLYFADDLSSIVKHDQAVFALAVQAANGLAPEVNGKQFETFIKTYLDAPLNLETIAAEIGIGPDMLQRVLQNSKGLSHVPVGLTQNPIRPCRRDQFENSFSEIQQAVLPYIGKRN
jgi:hypothetical protein